MKRTTVLDPIPVWSLLFLGVVGVTSICLLLHAYQILRIGYTGYVGIKPPPSIDEFYISAALGVLMAILFVLSGRTIFRGL